MKTDYLFNILAGIGILFGMTRLIQSCSEAVTASASSGDNTEALTDRGRYLVRTSGCNDCHTPGFMQKGEEVPESEWLTGVPVGWRGPWGTTYASNLRQHLTAWPESGAWIAMVRGRNGLPPMPWSSLHAMKDEDLSAVHAYILSLGVSGEVMPAPVPPDRNPVTPWLNLEPVMPPS